MLTVEENALAGGFGSAVLELLADRGALGTLRFRRLGVPDQFVEHGSQKELRARLGINRDGILEALHHAIQG
jgi:1-deoxy-D-xylulose-5-phosphate synthase